ncbi:Protein of unknown function [Gryllus bimaculatus]|nr:Protein of unknown function [Gryllus bimaculatus]
MSRSTPSSGTAAATSSTATPPAKTPPPRSSPTPGYTSITKISPRPTPRGALCGRPAACRRCSCWRLAALPPDSSRIAAAPSPARRRGAEATAEAVATAFCVQCFRFLNKENCRSRCKKMWAPKNHGRLKKLVM